ncbi:MAG: Flp pilus assembly protein CpaB [Candidatus Melainabacteria bacterium RIFCSPHIGHO2_02_FULL_34_12]|nr:MAG: Flp pilus assembly protein CpaB [Candidatus Melainabacteria bacterium RIFCSPHIGHO2_02_FULL_34_12]
MAINSPSLNPKTKNKAISLMVMSFLALFLGLIAAFGVWQYLSKTQQQVKELSVTRAVITAAKEIPAGTKITDDHLAVKQLPVHGIPKDYPSSVELIKGRIAKNTIQTEEIIGESRLVAEGAEGSFTQIIPPGQRAITIRVNEVVGVGGFLNPGDHVDILSIIKKGDDKVLSKTILQNVLILAAGDKVIDPNSVADPKPKITSQITVALNLNDSEKLALAAQQGELQLVLRPRGEVTQLLSNGTTLNDVYDDFYREEMPGIQPSLLASTSEDKDSPKNFIEIISGNQKSYYYY